MKNIINNINELGKEVLLDELYRLTEEYMAKLERLGNNKRELKAFVYLIDALVNMAPDYSCEATEFLKEVAESFKLEDILHFERKVEIDPSLSRLVAINMETFSPFYNHKHYNILRDNLFEFSYILLRFADFNNSSRLEEIYSFYTSAMAELNNKALDNLNIPYENNEISLDDCFSLININNGYELIGYIINPFNHALINSRLVCGDKEIAIPYLEKKSRLPFNIRLDNNDRPKLSLLINETSDEEASQIYIEKLTYYPDRGIVSGIAINNSGRDKAFNIYIALIDNEGRLAYATCDQVFGNLHWLDFETPVIKSDNIIRIDAYAIEK